MSKTRPTATTWVLDLLFLDPHHHHPLKEIPLPLWQSELYLFSAVFRFMFCPHLHCRNLGLPHVIGVSRAVIYMSLVGPTSIYRELETCPAKLVLDTATSLWNRLMQFWNCDAHLRDNPPFTSTSKSMGAFSEWTFTTKAGLVKFGSKYHTKLHFQDVIVPKKMAPHIEGIPMEFRHLSLGQGLSSTSGSDLLQPSRV